MQQHHHHQYPGGGPNRQSPACKPTLKNSSFHPPFCEHTGKTKDPRRIKYKSLNKQRHPGHHMQTLPFYFSYAYAVSSKCYTLDKYTILSIILP